uniref:Peptidase M12B domain-containing protein n=1 Tax=Amblyomma maculatum TaxID=34609 RepID=G3MQ17_AMBMU
MYHTSFFIFLVLQAEALQKSRLVYPRLLEERSSDGRLVVHVHDDLTLNLRKASVAAPQIRVLTEENGRSVTKFYKGEDIDRHLYEDETKIASVMLHKSAHGVQMRGLIGPKHRIQPMPVMEKAEDAVIPHAIYEIEQQEMLDKTLKLDETAREAFLSERTAQQSAGYPDLVVVEVFIVSDRRHHRYFDATNHLLWYLCIMLNSANIRYRDAKEPKIKLMLTGVEKPQVESYAIVIQEDYLFDEETLTRFRRYAYGNKAKYGNPDVVFLMTGYDVCTVNNGRTTDAGLGIGYVSGVCTSSYVALGEDTPGLFTGVHTFTHEVAHLLGAKHDGDGADLGTPGHPGATGCPWSLGHIMSYKNNGPEHHQFSRCSLQQMQHVLRLKGQACWTSTSGGYLVRNKYPGMMVQLREFCDHLVTDKQNYTFDSVRVDPENCKVWCFYNRTYMYDVFGDGSSFTVTYTYKGDALDYTPCKEDMVCIQSRCVNNPALGTETTKLSQPTTSISTATEESTTTTDTVTTECVCDNQTTPPSTTKSTRQNTTRMFWWRHATRRW